jgi:hypothetical protein
MQRHKGCVASYRIVPASLLSHEPFEKAVEWFNSLVSMEEVYRFPILRLKPSDAPPSFVIPQKEDALQGSPISRLARLRFDPPGLAFAGVYFQPLQYWGWSGRTVRMATQPFKIGPADSDIVCRNSRAEVG